MRVVLDTNVLVSALLKEESVPDQALRLIIKNEIVLAIDHRIWDEYEQVTLRPALRIPAKLRETRLFALRAISEIISASPLKIPDNEILDVKDLPFAEIAVAAKARYLLTGNKKHFGFMRQFNLPVVSPSEFIEKLQSGE
jgi:putative PIN family toxin of toxin-antitoxin system